MNNANFSEPPSRFVMPIVTALLAVLIAAAPARADVLAVSLLPLTNVAAGSTGDSFDVLLTNTSGPAVSIAGFFFEVMTSSSDVTFTDATTSTGAPYIFGANSLFGPDIIGPGSTATNLSASDLDSANSISLVPGATLGLGHVLFDVSPTALPQTVNFTLTGFPGTSLADGLGNNVPIKALTGGQFAITTTPEPSAVILLLTTLPLALGGRRLMRLVRRAKAARS